MNEPRKGSTSYGVSPDVEIVVKTLQPSVLSQIYALKNILICLITPIVAIFLFFIGESPAYRCAYLIVLMAVFWITEAVPIAVTSLLPVILCPIMGILTAKEVSATYMNNTSMLFLGGLTIAIAIETWNLHKRIALAVLLLFGSEPRWVMAGLMLVTWFLSMWISNTATTAMMMPIAQAILQQLRDGVNVNEDDNDTGGYENAAFTTEMDDLSKRNTTSNDVVNNDVMSTEDDKNETKSSTSDENQTYSDAKYLKMCKAMSLSVAYAANTGGIASLTGTGPNLVLKGQSDIVFEKYGVVNPITFATWMIYGLPLSFIVLIVLWVWLQIVFLRCKECSLCSSKKPKDDAVSKNVRKVILRAYKALGPVSFAQKIIMVLFGMLVILWITRDLGGRGGWGLIFKPTFITDSTPALLIGFLLFVLPSSMPNIFCFRSSDDTTESELVPILNWRDIHEKMPWSLYLLLGGGFALARAAHKTGLSAAVGNFLLVFQDLNPWLMLLIICYIITFFTEVTSNTAIATLMMPILSELAKALNVNPLFFMFPTALTTSFAFMLPAATPPNAIVFSFGQVRVIDMALCGVVMNLVTVPILIGATASWGNAYFHFDTLPEGFNFNVTTTTTAP